MSPIISLFRHNTAATLNFLPQCAIEAVSGAPPAKVQQ